MAVSMVSDPESEQELAESHLMLKNNCLGFRISSSFVGNNPSLQIQKISTEIKSIVNIYMSLSFKVSFYLSDLKMMNFTRPSICM
jgi:hypothetical protein